MDCFRPSNHQLRAQSEAADHSLLHVADAMEGGGIRIFSDKDQGLMAQSQQGVDTCKTSGLKGKERMRGRYQVGGQEGRKWVSDAWVDRLDSTSNMLRLALAEVVSSPRAWGPWSC